MLRWPVDARWPIGQPWGFDPDYGGNAEHFHLGIDWLAPLGAAYRAPVSGIVRLVEDRWPSGELRLAHRPIIPVDGAWGRYLEIEPDGFPEYRVGLAHASGFWVSVGQHVEAGQLVAQVGDSGLAWGPHAHLQLLHQFTRIDPTLSLLVDRMI